jgi:hypothetical protein
LKNPKLGALEKIFCISVLRENEGRGIERRKELTRQVDDAERITATGVMVNISKQHAGTSHGFKNEGNGCKLWTKLVKTVKACKDRKSHACFNFGSLSALEPVNLNRVLVASQRLRLSQTKFQMNDCSEPRTEEFES